MERSSSNNRLASIIKCYATDLNLNVERKGGYMSDLNLRTESTSSTKLNL